MRSQYRRLGGTDRRFDYAVILSKGYPLVRGVMNTGPTASKLKPLSIGHLSDSAPNISNTCLALWDIQGEGSRGVGQTRTCKPHRASLFGFGGNPALRETSSSSWRGLKRAHLGTSFGVTPKYRGEVSQRLPPSCL